MSRAPFIHNHHAIVVCRKIDESIYRDTPSSKIVHSEAINERINQANDWKEIQPSKDIESEWMHSHAGDKSLSTEYNMWAPATPSQAAFIRDALMARRAVLVGGQAYINKKKDQALETFTDPSCTFHLRSTAETGKKKFHLYTANVVSHFDRTKFCFRKQEVRFVPLYHNHSKGASTAGESITLTPEVSVVGKPANAPKRRTPEVFRTSLEKRMDAKSDGTKRVWEEKLLKGLSNTIVVAMPEKNQIVILSGQTDIKKSTTLTGTEHTVYRHEGSVVTKQYHKKGNIEVKLQPWRKPIDAKSARKLTWSSIKDYGEIAQQFIDAVTQKKKDCILSAAQSVVAETRSKYEESVTKKRKFAYDCLRFTEYHKLEEETFVCDHDAATWYCFEKHWNLFDEGCNEFTPEELALLNPLLDASDNDLDPRQQSYMEEGDTANAIDEKREKAFRNAKILALGVSTIIHPPWSRGVPVVDYVETALFLGTQVAQDNQNLAIMRRIESILSVDDATVPDNVRDTACDVLAFMCLALQEPHDDVDRLVQSFCSKIDFETYTDVDYKELLQSTLMDEAMTHIAWQSDWLQEKRKAQIDLKSNQAQSTQDEAAAQILNSKEEPSAEEIEQANQALNRLYQRDKILQHDNWLGHIWDALNGTLRIDESNGPYANIEHLATPEKRNLENGKPNLKFSFRDTVKYSQLDVITPRTGLYIDPGEERGFKQQIEEQGDQFLVLQSIVEASRALTSDFTKLFPDRSAQTLLDIAKAQQFFLDDELPVLMNDKRFTETLNNLRATLLISSRRVGFTTDVSAGEGAEAEGVAATLKVDLDTFSNSESENNLKRIQKTVKQLKADTFYGNNSDWIRFVIYSSSESDKEDENAVKFGAAITFLNQQYEENNVPQTIKKFFGVLCNFVHQHQYYGLDISASLLSITQANEVVKSKPEITILEAWPLMRDFIDVATGLIETMKKFSPFERKTIEEFKNDLPKKALTTQTIDDNIKEGNEYDLDRYNGLLVFTLMQTPAADNIPSEAWLLRLLFLMLSRQFVVRGLQWTAMTSEPLQTTKPMDTFDKFDSYADQPQAEWEKIGYDKAKKTFLDDVLRYLKKRDGNETRIMFTNDELNTLKDSLRLAVEQRSVGNLLMLWPMLDWNVMEEDRYVKVNGNNYKPIDVVRGVPANPMRVFDHLTGTKHPEILKKFTPVFMQSGALCDKQYIFFGIKLGKPKSKASTSWWSQALTLARPATDESVPFIYTRDRKTVDDTELHSVINDIDYIMEEDSRMHLFVTTMCGLISSPKITDGQLQTAYTTLKTNATRIHKVLVEQGKLMMFEYLLKAEKDTAIQAFETDAPKEITVPDVLQMATYFLATLAPGVMTSSESGTILQVMVRGIGILQAARSAATDSALEHKAATFRQQLAIHTEKLKPMPATDQDAASFAISEKQAQQLTQIQKHLLLYNTSIQTVLSYNKFMKLPDDTELPEGAKENYIDPNWSALQDEQGKKDKMYVVRWVLHAVRLIIGFVHEIQDADTVTAAAFKTWLAMHDKVSPGFWTVTDDFFTALKVQMQETLVLTQEKVANARRTSEAKKDTTPKGPKKALVLNSFKAQIRLRYTTDSKTVPNGSTKEGKEEWTTLYKKYMEDFVSSPGVFETGHFSYAWLAQRQQWLESLGGEPAAWVQANQQKLHDAKE